jgi:hypothetical protein
MILLVLSILTLLVSLALLYYLRQAPAWQCPRCGRELEREVRASAGRVVPRLLPLVSSCGGCGWSGRSRRGEVPGVARVRRSGGGA